MSTTEPADLITSVRLRPGMFVGDNSDFGLSHLAYLLLDAAICDPRRGSATRLEVSFGADDTVEISSDAVPLSEVQFEAGARLPEDRPVHPTGLEWTIIAALAERLEVSAWGAERSWQLEMRRGEVFSRSASWSPPLPWPQGMQLRLKPDRSIFTAQARFDVVRVFDRIRHLAALFPGLRGAIRDENTGAESVRLYPRGMSDLLGELAPDATFLTEPLVADVRWDQFRIRCAVQWDTVQWAPPRVWSWANTVPTPKGGAHVDGLAEALLVPSLFRDPPAVVSQFESRRQVRDLVAQLGEAGPDVAVVSAG